MKKITLITFCAVATVLTAIGLTQKPDPTANALLASNVEALSGVEYANNNIIVLGDGRIITKDYANIIERNKVLNGCIRSTGEQKPWVMYF